MRRLSFGLISLSLSTSACAGDPNYGTSPSSTNSVDEGADGGLDTESSSASSDGDGGDGDSGDGDSGDGDSGDGDSGDGDGDSGDSGDGDSGDGDSGDGDGDSGDGDSSTGDGDGDSSTGDGDSSTGDGDSSTGDGDGDPNPFNCGLVCDHIDACMLVGSPTCVEDCSSPYFDDTSACQELASEWILCISSAPCGEVFDCLNQVPGNPCQNFADAYIAAC